MDGKTIFISPKRFLNHFLRSATTNGPPELPNLFGSFKVDEQNLHDRLMNTLNDAPDLCLGFQFAVTKTGPEQDIICGLYAAGHVPVDQARADATNAQPSPISCNDNAADGERCAKGEYPAVDWSRLELPIIVTTEASEDPYNQSAHDFETETDNDLRVRKRVLRSIEACAQLVFDYQPRTHQYMVLVVSDTARLIYIDRAGMVVTTAFNYTTNGCVLIEFLWRFARMTEEGRGIDTTARRLEEPNAPEEHKALVEEMKRELQNLPQNHKLNLYTKSITSGWPLRLLSFVDERTHTECKFIVGKPNFQAKGVAGRTTQGYVAYDCINRKRRLVYLKDSWRVVHHTIIKEGDVLQLLNAAGAPFVPTLAYHGDLGQSTISQDFWSTYHPDEDFDARCALKKHEHYRLVVEEVGKPLSEFETGVDLFAAVYCCLRAHHAAYQLNILHGDISEGNILLVPADEGGAGPVQWIGMLNDWELAKNVTEQEPTARRLDRTGTWQFLSVAALRECDKSAVVQDDLESFFHVLLYMAIRFLPHNCPKELVGKLLFEFFDDATETPRGYGCGRKKAETMKTGVIDFELDGKVVNLKFTWADDQNIVHPINDILATLLGWLRAYYATLLPQEPEPRAGPGGDAHGLKKQAFLEKLRIPGMSEDAPPPPPPRALNPARFEDADKLASHDAIIALFDAYLDLKKYEWPAKEKIEDNAVAAANVAAVVRRNE